MTSASTTTANPDVAMPRMLGPQEVADMLNIGRRTFDRFRSQGIIPPPDFERGKIIRWWPRTILHWLKADEREVLHGS